MAQIGEFVREKDCFSGRIETLTLACDVTLVAAEVDDNDGNLPTYRIYSGSGDEAPEIGVAWERHSDKAGEYLSLLIDDPGLPQPIRANLFRNGNGSLWSLVWHRTPRRAGKN